MKKTSLILDLPYLASAAIIQYMDYKTRYNLGICSKKTANLIKIVPIAYSKLEFAIGSECASVSVRDTTQNRNDFTYFWKEPDETCTVMFNRGTIFDIPGNYNELAVDELKKTLCFDNTRIGYLHISGEYKYNERSEVSSSIRTILRSLKKQLKVETVEISCHEDLALDFLSYIQPGTLKNIIVSCDGERKVSKITKIVNTEQWKQATRIVIDHHDIEVPIELSRSFPRFVNTRKIDIKQLEVVIENMFEFRTRERILFVDIDPFNDEFGIPFEFDSHSEIYTFRRQGSPNYYAKRILNLVVVLNHDDFGEYEKYKSAWEEHYRLPEFFVKLL